MPPILTGGRRRRNAGMVGHPYRCHVLRVMRAHAYPVSYQVQAHAGITYAGCHGQPPHSDPLPTAGEGERGRAPYIPPNPHLRHSRAEPAPKKSGAGIHPGKVRCPGSSLSRGPLQSGGESGVMRALGLRRTHVLNSICAGDHYTPAPPQPPTRPRVPFRHFFVPSATIQGRSAIKNAPHATLAQLRNEHKRVQMVQFLRKIQGIEGRAHEI